MVNPITAETRAESFLAISTNRRQEQVIDALVGYDKGLTAEEVASRMDVPTYQARPRLTELIQRGIVTVIGKRRSPITGRNIAMFALMSEIIGQR